MLSIRKKLLLSYSWTMTATLVLFAAAALLITLTVMGDVRSVGDLYTNHFTLKPLGAVEYSLYTEMKELAKATPGRLLDSQLQKDYDLKLRMAQAAMVIRKEQETKFVSPSLTDPAVPGALPDYKMENYNIRDTMLIGNRFYAYAKYDFYFDDRSRGSVYVLRELSPFTEMVRKLLPVLVGVLFFVLLVTGGMLFVYVTRSIVGPLASLKASAEKIKDGLLDFEVVSNRSDEIGELSRAFEEMRRRLKESVELQLQYEDNRKELISSISHDLKTPITTIKGYIEGIRDGVPNTKEKMDKYVGTIYAKTVEMDKLIDELFLFSMLDLRKMPFQFEAIDLRAFLREWFEELMFDVEEQQVRLDVHLGGFSPLPVMADREKLRRAIVNIVGNSLKYMNKPDKRITVHLHESDGQAILSIADNGPGIPPEAVARVFDKFYRAEPSRNSGTGGSGLGLAIAKQIMEGHNGGIWVESMPGEGTVMYLSLHILKEGETVNAHEKSTDH